MVKRYASRTILILLTGLPILYWLVLLVAPRTFGHIWFWFWFAKVTPLPHWWLLIPFAAMVFLAFYLLRRFRSALAAVLLVCLVGYTGQWTFTLMEGRGIEPMSEKMTYPEIAHSFFAEKAVGIEDVPEMIEQYDLLIARDSLPRFPFITKPPGHFLTYIATDRLGRLLLGTPAAPTMQIDQVARFASFLWPLLVCLALLPLYTLARRFLSEPESCLVLLLYALSPNILLMTMHLDQALLPTLFLSVIVLFLYGIDKRSYLLQALSGITLGVASFFSFSMVTLVPLLALWQGGREVLHRRREGNSFRQALLSGLLAALPSLLFLVAGALLFHLLIWILFSYNWLAGYQVAQEAHGIWKIQEWDLVRTIWVGFLDLFEYAVWIGFPIAILALLRSSVTLKRLRLLQIRPVDTMIISLLFLLILLAFFGKTVAETGRLWIFLLPLVLIVAVMGLRLFPKRIYRPLVFLILVLQLLHTFFMRWLQDFA